MHKQRQCPHCGKIGGGGAMTRYHFDNCDMADGGAKKTTKKTVKEETDAVESFIGVFFLALFVIGLIWWQTPTSYEIMLHNRQFRCEHTTGTAYCGDNKIGSFRLFLWDKMNPNSNKPLR